MLGICCFLPIGCVLSSQKEFIFVFSTCFKANMAQVFELISKVKSRYDTELVKSRRSWLSAPRFCKILAHFNKQIQNPQVRQKISKNTTVHNKKRCDVGTLWFEYNLKLPNIFFAALVQSKSLEKRLFKRQAFKEKVLEYLVMRS